MQRCVDSIPEREDIQIIVVDDNSNDLNKPQLDRKDVVVVWLNSEQSNGAGRARNVGFQHAKGRWVLFADADDYYDNMFIETLDLYKDFESDVVYFSFNLISSDMKCSLPLYHEWISYAKSDQEFREKVKFLHHAPWNKMVKRNFIIEKCIEFEETINGNDIFYTFQVGWYSNNAIFLEDSLYNYVSSPNSVSDIRAMNRDALLCKLKHVVQSNVFKKRIGHSDWKIPILLYFFALWKSKGFVVFIKTIYLYVRYYVVIKKDKNKFVEFICDN